MVTCSSVCRCRADVAQFQVVFLPCEESLYAHSQLRERRPVFGVLVPTLRDNVISGENIQNVFSDIFKFTCRGK